MSRHNLWLSANSLSAPFWAVRKRVRLASRSEMCRAGPVRALAEIGARRGARACTQAAPGPSPPELSRLVGG